MAMATLTRIKPTFFGASTRYDNAPQEDEIELYARPIENDQAERIDGSRRAACGRALRKAIIRVLCFAWIAPILILLFWNIKGHTIGASAWCPNGDCWVDPNNNNTAVPQANMAKFDKMDHNLLGTLQLVAKVLEIWFVFIALRFMYFVTMYFAGDEHGLPVGFLALSFEFADPIASLYGLVSKTVAAIRGKRQTVLVHRRLRARLALLVFLSVLLCAVCNLMGPATAVLVIPSLQWLPTTFIGDQWFTSANAGSVPSVTGFAFSDSNCTQADFQAQRYSCSKHKWGMVLDSWVEAWVSSAEESPAYRSPPSQQADVSFYLNTTKYVQRGGQITSAINWAPNRALISDFSEDRRIITNISLGMNAADLGISQDLFDTYAKYNNSLSAQIQRSGPIIGTEPNLWWGYTNWDFWTLNLDGNDNKNGRKVMCFSNYELNIPIDPKVNNFTKCIQTGAGWNDTATNENNFTIVHDDSGSNVYTHPSMMVSVLSSNRAVLLPHGQLPSNTTFPIACIGNSTSTAPPANVHCNWTEFFSPNFNNYSSSNATQYVNTINFLQLNASNPFPFLMTIDYVAYLNKTTYTFDPSKFTNPGRLVETLDLPSTGIAIPMHPSWISAAWSADFNNGTIGNRSTTNLLLAVVDYYGGGKEEPDMKFRDVLSAIFWLPTLQTLSLIDYETSGTAPDRKSSDAWKPQLTRRARLFVWAYKDSSRTSKFGIAIASLGVVIVLVETLLDLQARKPRRELTDMLIAALTYSPRNDFAGHESGGLRHEHVRFRLDHAEHLPGELEFQGFVNQR